MRPLTRCYTALIALALVLVAAHSRADPYCTAESNPDHCAVLERQIQGLYYPRADNNFGRVDNLLALFYHRQLVAKGKAVERRADMSLGEPEQDYQRGLLFLSLSPENRAAVLAADTVSGMTGWWPAVARPRMRNFRPRLRPGVSLVIVIIWKKGVRHERASDHRKHSR